MSGKRSLVADLTLENRHVAVSTPIFHFLPRVGKTHEPMCIQTLRAEEPLNDSINALSVGFPGREKSSVTSC